MPNDITMCPGQDCPIRLQCYRFRAIPEGRQDWFGSTPYDHDHGMCESFWDIESFMPTEEQIRVRAYSIWQSHGCPENSAVGDWLAARSEFNQRLDQLLRPIGD